jgi:hypothetical protein
LRSINNAWTDRLLLDSNPDKHGDHDAKTDKQPEILQADLMAVATGIAGYWILSSKWPSEDTQKVKKEGEEIVRRAMGETSPQLHSNPIDHRR